MHRVRSRKTTICIEHQCRGQQKISMWMETNLKSLCTLNNLHGNNAGKTAQLEREMDDTDWI